MGFEPGSEQSAVQYLSMCKSALPTRHQRHLVVRLDHSYSFEHLLMKKKLRCSAFVHYRSIVAGITVNALG